MAYKLPVEEEQIYLENMTFYLNHLLAVNEEKIFAEL